MYCGRKIFKWCWEYDKESTSEQSLASLSILFFLVFVAVRSMCSTYASVRSSLK